MKALFTIVFLVTSLASCLSAQEETWFNNTDYPYVFNSTVDYFFEEQDLIDTAFNNYQNEQFRLKLDPKVVREYDGWLEDDTWLWDVVLQHLEAGTLVAYNTEDGQAIQTVDVLEKLVRTDTIISCFTSHFEEEPYHFITAYPDFMGWRLYLNWAWNESQQKLESNLNAIAPIFSVSDENGNFKYGNCPIFLQTVTTLGLDGKSLNDPKWAWAGQAKTMVSWQHIEMLKGSTDANFAESVFYQKALIEESIPLYHTDAGWWPEQQISVDEIKQIKCQTDSFFIIHPETFELRDTTVTYCLKPEDVQAAKLYYRLYFDPATAIFAYQPLSVQLVTEQLDENGNFRYYKPLYLLLID